MIRQRASALIETISLNEDQKKFLALFREYEYLSAEDILTASDGVDKTIRSSIGYLQEHGILEKDGRYLRLAPYLSDAVSRHKWNDIPIKAFIERAQTKFLERVKTLTTDDFVEISTVDHAILTALRTGKELGNQLISRALLPSHTLHVAQEFYHVQHFERAAELCEQALGRSYLLTREAQIEALRLRALALARRGKTDDFYRCVEQLEKYHERVAKRNAKFLRGFKLRWEGKPDQAEQFYREAYRLGGDRNFYVLRELAQVLASRGEFVEAEGYSRAAHRIAHRNPYVIDNLLEILIERNKDTLSSLSGNEEIKNLFALLQETAKLEERSFYESRMAHFYSVLKNPVRALQWANSAVEVTPSFIPVHITRVRALLAAGRIPEAEEKVRQIQRMLEDVGIIGDKRYGFEVDRLRAQIAIETRRYPQARTIIDQSADMPATVKETLRRDLAQAVIFSDGVDAAMMQWANRVLARGN